MSIEGPASAEVASKKRKRLSTRSLQEDAEASVKESKKPSHGGTWKNLDLILSLQDKDVPADRKIEVAFSFVCSKISGENLAREPLQAARVISFLTDWVQPVLISSDACYDYRLWIVLKFCLQKSATSLSHNLLRPITRAVIHASSFIGNGDEPSDGEDSSRFYEAFPECVSLLFSFHGRSFNAAGVELWISCAVAVVGLLLQILPRDRCSFLNENKLSPLSILLLDQFGNFLRFHPSPKSIFRTFVDRLLKPLVELLALLHANIGQVGHEHGGSLLAVVENSLCNGLCHPSHMNGFATLRNSNLKQEVPEQRKLNESYHRHFFVKFQDIVIEKNVGLMDGLGHLFQLFLNSLMNKQGASSSFKNILKLEKDQILPDQEHGSSKPLFEVFIQFMEPLFLDCIKFTEMNLSTMEESWETRLMRFCSSIRAINGILEGAVRKKIYDRTQDSPGRDNCSFLKRVYDVILIICRKIYVFWLSMTNVLETSSSEVLRLIAKELIVSVGYFLEIEYNVVDDDLTGIWFMMLSYLAISGCKAVASDDSLLRKVTLSVGCQMVNVYSDLRQASKPIFALSEAVRSFGYYDNETNINQSAAFPPGCLSPNAFRRAVATMVCSKDLKFAISNAIKTIPEGQTGECVHQLKSDFTEALSWLRTTLLSTCVETETFGLTSDIYSIVLESLVVTASNSILVGKSINELMTTVRLPFETFMKNQSCDFNYFYVSFTGKSLSERVTLVDASWIFLCFFRLYVSCRSLYMQAASLSPSVLSNKAAADVGKSFIVSSGKDWEKEESCISEGYFSWIVNPSISLISMINTFSEYSIEKKTTKIFPPLVYVLNVMGLQRLIDLNRKLKSLSYLVQKNKMLIQMRAQGDLGQLPQKQNKRLKHLIKVSKEEASDLTSFMTEFLHLFECTKTISVGEHSEGSMENAWDLSICSLDEGSLPIAIWQLLCLNIDVWCIHASRKSLKTFSSLLIQHWVDYSSSCKDTVERETSEQSKNYITFHCIAAEVLKDVAFYEQPVLLRHLTSRLLSVLKNAIHPLVSNAFGDNLDLGYPPDCLDVMPSIDAGMTSESYSVQSLWSSVKLDSSYPDVSSKQRAHSSLKPEYSTCEGLLNLLCKLSLTGIDQSTLSSAVCYSLHLERLLVFALMSFNEDSSYLHYELLRLFVCCRRTLKHLLVASCKDLSTFGLLLDNPSTIQWLLKSVSRVAGLQVSHFRDKPTGEVNMMFFQLMDHTSNLFVNLSERKINLDSSDGNFDAWKNLTTVAATLVAEIRTNVVCGKWNNTSSILSCVQGFLWGLVSALEVLDRKGPAENTPVFECLLDLEKSVGVFEEFMDSCLMLLLKSDNDQDDAEMLSMDGIEVMPIIHQKYHLRLPVLRSLLKGENTDIAFSLRHIFMLAAAILKFRHLTLFQKAKKRGHFHKYLQLTSPSLLLTSSNFISLKMCNIFAWMDGMLKYLEVLGRCFPEGDSVFSNSLYPKMVNMHLRAMGKCISLRSKTASASQQWNDDICAASLGAHKLEEFISRLRTSFKELIRKPLRSGFALLVQTLGRVLVDIHTKNPDVAAGLDFLDLVFDSFSGDKLFGLIKDYGKILFASLFNIILHLQGPLIFYKRASTFGLQKVNTEGGPTILICVEILRKFSRKNTQLKMDPSFVGQSLHVPSSLFKHFHKISSTSIHSGDILDSRFFVDLYANCCQLLCTVIRHQKSETAQCIALLEDSVNTLLKCLESSDDENVIQKGTSYALGIKEALTCANFLRRVYEEIKQQKDSMGTYASHFLSDYLCVCSELKREVDEALRPGVYALVDICSPGDFQKLHTILGEGQCRKTLATLRSDYRLYFQYQGKI